MKINLVIVHKSFVIIFNFRTEMFTTFVNPIFGNCYTFNSGVKKSDADILQSYKSGKQYGKASFTCN